MALEKTTLIENKGYQLTKRMSTLRDEMLRLAEQDGEILGQALVTVAEKSATNGASTVASLEDPTSLRDQVIRLAHDNPGPVRGALLPILAETKTAGIGQDVYKLFPRNSYLYRYFKEADLPHRVFDVTDSHGVEHSIPNTVVIQFMAQTGSGEQRKIEDTIRKIDFKAGDVNHFIAHLAKTLAEQYAGVLR